MSSSHTAHQQLGWTQLDQPFTPRPVASRSLSDVQNASRTFLRASSFSGSESNESAYSPNPTVHPALESTPLTGSSASTAPSTPFNTPVATPVASPVLGPDKPVHLPGSIPVTPPLASPVAASPQIDDDPVFLRALEEDLGEFWADRVEGLESEIELRQSVIASYQREIAELAEHAGKAERSLRADLLVHLQNQQEARERLAQATEKLEALRAKEQVQLAPVAEEAATPAGPAEEANEWPALDESMSAIQSIAQLAKSLLNNPHPTTFTPASPQTLFVSAPAPTPAPTPAALPESTKASILVPAVAPVATLTPDRELQAPVVQSPVAPRPVTNNVQRVPIPLSKPASATTPTEIRHTQRATGASDNGKLKLVKKPKLLHELKWLAQVGGAGNSVVVGKRRRSDDDEKDSGSDKRPRTQDTTGQPKEENAMNEWGCRLRKRIKVTRESLKREEAAADVVSDVAKPVVGEKRRVGRPRKEERR